MLNSDDNQKFLRHKRQPVKAQIVAAGIKLGDLAAASNMAQPTLSQYLTGSLRDSRRRRDIWIAFRSLSGSDISFEAFWGELLSNRIAG